MPLERRAGLLAAVGALRRNDTLVIAKRDRLGRDVLNVAMIQRLVERKGCRVVSAAGEGGDDDTPTSRLMRQIIDCFAEYEKAIIGARTSAALQQKKLRGERTGTIPFGRRLSQDGRALEDHPAEQMIIAFIRTERAAGATLQAIADKLNNLGHRTRPGGKWVQQYCRRILNRR